VNIQSVLDSGELPVVAILRGLTPADAAGIGEVLIAGGIRIIEVPFNSPEPLASIERLVTAFGSHAVVGAGTVVTVANVDDVAAAGGQLIVSPHTDAGVIRRAIALGLECLPGFTSPTEAFTAIAAGATDLKLFPAASLGQGHLKALREVLPRQARVWAVGGTGAHDLTAWMSAGASGIGVGGSLYKPGDTSQQVLERAIALRSAWRGSTASRP